MGLRHDVDPLLDWEWEALKLHLTGSYKTFFPLLMITGIRTSEALALGARDLWTEGSRSGITVQRLKTTRQRHDRLIVPNARLFAELEVLGRKHRGLLFDFSRVAAWKALKRFCAAAGIRRLSPHQFRHTYAVLFTRTSQTDPSTGLAMTALEMRIQLAYCLGHSDPRSVDIYFRPHGAELMGRTASVGTTFAGWFN